MVDNSSRVTSTLLSLINEPVCLLKWRAILYTGSFAVVRFVYYFFFRINRLSLVYLGEYSRPWQCKGYYKLSSRMWTKDKLHD